MDAIFSYCPHGYYGCLVHVDTKSRPGIPGIDIVGLPGAAVRESRERIKVVLRTLGLNLPGKRFLVNLSPAGLKKEGAGYDLAIAVSLLKEMGTGLKFSSGTSLILGEMLLDGTIHRTNLSLPALRLGIEKGIAKAYVPHTNYRESHLLNGIEIEPLSNIRQLLAEEPENSILSHINLEDLNSQASENPKERLIQRREKSLDPFYPNVSTFIDASISADRSKVQEKNIDQLHNLRFEKFCLLVAASGLHNALFVGPPGQGKSHLIHSIGSLLPEMTTSDSLETLHLHSLHGDAENRLANLAVPPIRSPHHQTSLEGMIGGGRNLIPGEISLAHNGALILDELPEFRRNVIQALREPIQEGTVHLARANSRTSFPSRFILLSAMNLCACGNRGVEDAFCRCTSQDMYSYWSQIGGAIYDRFDIRLNVPFLRNFPVLESLDLSLHNAKEMIARARKKQKERNPGSISNSALNFDQLKNIFLTMDGNSEKIDLEPSKGSMRSRMKIMQLSLTIMDLFNDDIQLFEAFELATMLRKNPDLDEISFGFIGN